MLELHVKKLCTLVAVPNELLELQARLPDLWLTPEQFQQFEDLERWADRVLSGPTPDHIVGPLPEPPECCEHCGRAEPLQDFRGWRHEAGECSWLCGDCYSTATMEE